MTSEPQATKDGMQAIRKLALKIAEAMNDHWRNLFVEGYDVDEAADLIAMYIPLTRAEADAEIDALMADKDEPAVPRKPSQFAQLCEALGVVKDGPIGLVMNDCIRKARELNAITPRKDSSDD